MAGQENYNHRKVTPVGKAQLRGLSEGRDHICYKGGSGKGRGDVLLWAVKSRYGSHSQGQGGRESSASSGRTEHSSVAEALAWTGLGWGRPLGQGTPRGDSAMGWVQEGQCQGELEGLMGTVERTEWRKKRGRSKATGIISFRGTGRMVGTNYS